MVAAPSAFARLAAITRGGLEESWHLGAVAVVEPGGGLLARAGDPGLETFVRSAAKPWQALPLVLAGGVERYQLDAADLALVCASHSGTPAHTARVVRLLERGGFGIEALQCGVHPPLDEAAADELRRHGEPPSALHNNCSGKHAGMLLACALLGVSSDDYLDPSHLLQRRVVELVGAFCRVPPAEIGLGIDGCSAPTPRLSLRAAATGYAALAAPEEASPDPDEGRAAAAVAQAMTGAPEMVAGPGRFTTRLMQATAGRIIGK
jgi:L-asparaginase II